MTVSGSLIRACVLGAFMSTGCEVERWLLASDAPSLPALPRPVAHGGLCVRVAPRPCLLLAVFSLTLQKGTIAELRLAVETFAPVYRVQRRPKGAPAGLHFAAARDADSIFLWYLVPD